MGVNRKTAAAVLTVIGAGLLITGAALIYTPAAFLLAGLLAGAAGMFGVDVG